jgi:hypothetical protein
LNELLAARNNYLGIQEITVDRVVGIWASGKDKIEIKPAGTRISGVWISGQGSRTLGKKMFETAQPRGGGYSEFVSSTGSYQVPVMHTQLSVQNWNRTRHAH